MSESKADASTGKDVMDKVQEVFEQLCELPAEERASFLEQALGQQTDLRVEVESLLNAHDSAGDFLLNPTTDYVDPNTAPLGFTAGDVIDRYKLLERIGEGGFGVVYMAQQLEPIKRRLALKIIKLGMDTKQVVARFEAERQALAMMNHPNIARVLDGGATETGRPYFVMELVRGEPITTYSDNKRLSTEERLDLILQVCEAVQHAHQKGIIHRDIKPTNVLVTVADDKPVAKVIDFGIAKATNHELTEKTLFTEFRQLIGTPAYMSPEQAERSGVDVDTRTDIYSLGVLMYEVLTGTTPFDFKRLRSAAWGTLQEIILDEDPPPPSTRVSTLKDELDTVARYRQVEPGRLKEILSGELDWIVMRAIEKDRTRRYSATSELADDIRRYLADEPVLAGPPSATYRWRKYAKRYRVPLMAAATALAALLLGLVASLWMMFWALSERDHARAAERQAKQQAARAERFSNLAGNLVGSGAQTDRSKSEWEQEIKELKATLPADDKYRIRQECNYVTWLCNHALFNDVEEYKQEVAELVDELYPRARQHLEKNDVHFFGVSNAYLQVNMLFREGDIELAAAAFEEFMESAMLIHGAAHPIVHELTLEYAVVLLRSQRLADAVQQLDRYLGNVDKVKEYSFSHRLRLKMLHATIEEYEFDGERPAQIDKINAIYDEHAKNSDERIRLRSDSKKGDSADE